MVGNRSRDHHKHRCSMEEEDHDQAQRPPPGYSEKAYPQQCVPEVEEYVRPHQIEGLSKSPKGTRLRSDLVGSQSEGVDDKRYQETEQVNPVPAIQRCPQGAYNLNCCHPMQARREHTQFMTRI